MYGAAQPDFLKSKTNGGIKNIISHHLKIIIDKTNLKKFEDTQLLCQFSCFALALA